MTSFLQSAHTAAGGARTQGSRITVVLADDHQMVRRTLRLLLNGETDIDVIAEASDVFTAVRHVRDYGPQVLLLDLRLPNGSSLEVIRQLHAQAPGTQIVVITMEDSPAFAQQAIALGASGYVLKDNADSELPLAIRRAAGGQRYLSPRVARFGGSEWSTLMPPASAG